MITFVYSNQVCVCILRNATQSMSLFKVNDLMSDHKRSWNNCCEFGLGL